MGKHKNKNKSSIPEIWRNMQGVIWMVGLAILAIKGWWWPGILILVAISIIYESVLSMAFPSQAVEETPAPPTPPVPPAPPTPPVPPTPPIPPAPAKVEASPIYPVHLLPTNCPRCGAPARGHDVHWTSGHSADCAFCGANLPLGR